MGWIGVDLDGTLAHHDPDDHFDPMKIGEPIPEMVGRVKGWLAKGYEVRVMTARVNDELYHSYQSQSGTSAWYRDYFVRRAILQWTREHIGKSLQATNCKDYSMIELWDDRAVSVVANTGRPFSQEMSRIE